MVEQVSLRSFVIDAGHGGYDYGVKGSRFSEKDFVLAFARDLAGILLKNGKDVQLTRKTDMVMTLAERINAANKRMPELFISFHVSSTKVPSVYTVPDRTDEGRRFSGQKRREISMIVSEAVARNIEKDFSVSLLRETLPLPLLLKVKSPAIIIELPNPDEFNFDKKSRDRMLSAILKGLVAVSKEDRAGIAPPKPEVKPEKKTESKSVITPAAKPEKKPQSRPENRPQTEAEIKPEKKAEDTKEKQVKE
jgi:N-acetylmuramoyl-L-alanine amidase